MNNIVNNDYKTNWFKLNWGICLSLVFFITFLVLTVCYFTSKDNLFYKFSEKEVKAYLYLDLSDKQLLEELGFNAKYKDNSSKKFVLDSIGLDKVEFSEDFFNFFKDKIEVTFLANGGIVLKSNLIDEQKWFFLTGGNNDQAGELTVLERNLFSINNNNRYFWTIDDNSVYFFSNMRDGEIVNRKKTRSFAKLALKANLMDKKVGFYLADLNAKDIADSTVYDLFAKAQTFPLVVSIEKKSDNEIVLQVRTVVNAELDTIFKGDFGKKAFVKGDFVLEGYGLGGDVFNKSIYYLSGEKEQNNILNIAESLYSVDFSNFFKKIRNRKVIFAYEKEKLFNSLPQNNWFLYIMEKQSEDPYITETLSGLAKSFFAFSHPIEEKSLLLDNTFLTEYRVDFANNGAPKNIKWFFNKKEYNFSAYQKNGELDGYFVAFMPEFGYILTNSLDYLSKNFEILDNDTDKIIQNNISDTNNSHCLSKKDILSRLAVSQSILNQKNKKDEAISNFKKVFLTQSSKNLINICFKY